MNVYSRSSKISTQFTLNIRKMWTFQVLSEHFKFWVALGLPPRFPLPGFLCLSVCRVFWTVRVTVSTKTKRYSRILVQNQTSNVHKHRMWSVKAEKSTVTRMSANLAFSHRFSCWKLFTWSKVTKTRFLSYKSHYFLKSTPPYKHLDNLPNFELAAWDIFWYLKIEAAFRLCWHHSGLVVCSKRFVFNKDSFFCPKQSNSANFTSFFTYQRFELLTNGN